jgi:CBS domain containing-hemolysin-like protein
MPTILLVKYFGDDGDLYALLIYSPIFLIFGEIVPKSIYQQNANTIAPAIVRVLRLFSLLFYPIIFIFSRIARRTHQQQWPYCSFVGQINEIVPLSIDFP